ncbi:MAG: hypothetical protein OEP52_11940 [Acidimicrobiia bacterium]|jgi:hypothetical protein|nr:hypothetical protein [Acidimicrobiia bacterium]
MRAFAPVVGTREGDDGYVTVQFVVAVAFSLVLLVLIANIIVVQYARGVVRAAAEEGAQAGSRLSATSLECEDRADEVLASLLGGAMGAGVTVSCTVGPTGVAATVQYTFTPWLPLIPAWTGSQASFAVKESPPS